MDAFRPMADAGQVVLGLTSFPGNFNRNVKRGEGNINALSNAALDTANLTFLHPVTMIATGGLSALACAAYKGFKRANANTHQVATPFSQRFEHTQMSSQLQSYGMSRMSGMRGVGSEAALMYGRFGRNN